ncbi:hypothetical protein [Nocardioides aquiterrae]|uniref:WD40 repeat domain-containing protein n=1 Tax=Nocardioides aquiterrae TaxID=203799 RepID=A0ABN1UNF1_9ACTN
MSAAARVARLATVMLAGALISVLPRPAVAAAPSPVDPAALSRGADPTVVHLVRDTIHDGALRVPATERGRHDALWVVSGGYLLRDYNVGHPHHVVVVFVDPAGARRVVARSRDWIDVAASPSGERVATEHATGPGLLRSVVTVSDPATGRVVASRTMRLVTLAAVTDHRVLLGKRARWHDPATVWWNYDRDRRWRLYDEAALGADVRHDRVVFDRTDRGEFCLRVAVLSRPGHTLWRGCGRYPHQWSPDGSLALASWSYFDAAGTDRWWVVDGRTGAPRSMITGRLDWDAVWEDDTHFLTLAQGEEGGAAIIRCDLDGVCERASRIWDVPVPEEPSLYYAPPPVVLAGNQAS